MNVYTVSEFTKRVTEVLGGAFPETVTVTGEVSNLSRPSSGHIYFTLKDTASQLKAAFFKRYAVGAGVFIPKNGDKVKVVGDITVYGADGSYQILVKRVFYDSEGDFWKKFEETKRKLEAEGLLNDQNKRPITEYPKRVALITSVSGAAIKDFIVTTQSEGGMFRIDVWGVPVQGAEAASKIAMAVKKAGDMVGFYDAVVIMRGGGSLDDLSVFNDETVARGIALSKVPTISAVGHERDVSIADFAADKRVATPTAAAVFLSSAYKRANGELRKLEEELLKTVITKIDNMHRKLDLIELKIKNASPANIIAGFRNRIEMAERSLMYHTKNRAADVRAFLNRAFSVISANDPKIKIPALTYRIDGLHEKIFKFVSMKIQKYSARLNSCNSSLNALNPENVLDRGYALVFKNGLAVTGVKALGAKDFIEIKLKDGYVNSFVDSIISEGINGKNTNNS